MRSLYDNVTYNPSIDPQGDAGGSQVAGSAVDTLGFNTGMLVARIGVASNNTTLGSVITTFKLQECATSNGTFTDALDNTGVVIGGNYTQKTPFAAATIIARIEGLGSLNRKRYLKVVETSTYTAGAGSTIALSAEILLGRGYNLPDNTTASNT